MTSPLADRIRRLLQRRGWQQSDLARESRVSEATISRLLAGEQRNPTAGTLSAIAKALQVPVDEILLDEGNSSAGDSLEAALVDLYRLLPAEERAKILDYAEAIALRRQLVANNKGESKRMVRVKQMLSMTQLS